MRLPPVLFAFAPAACWGERLFTPAGGRWLGARCLALKRRFFCWSWTTGRPSDGGATPALRVPDSVPLRTDRLGNYGGVGAVALAAKAERPGRNG